MNKIGIALFLVLGLYIVFSSDDEVIYGPGVKAPDDPAQTAISDATSFAHNEYNITPLATFHIKAKVLSKERYRIGRESDLSPVDLALGWGPMSDEGVIDSIDISQSGRWYRWNVDQFPIPRREIETNSANMHLIPANDLVESDIMSASKGDIIEIRGKLVRVDASDGWRWISSMSRDDTGGHACELIWVDSFRVHTI